MERYDEKVFPQFQQNTSMQSNCSSLALEGLEDYPMSVHLNQRQPETQTTVQ
jgi:hypothetical protein